MKETLGIKWETFTKKTLLEFALKSKDLDVVDVLFDKYWQQLNQREVTLLYNSFGKRKAIIQEILSLSPEQIPRRILEELSHYPFNFWNGIAETARDYLQE